MKNIYYLFFGLLFVLSFANYSYGKNGNVLAKNITTKLSQLSPEMLATVNDFIDKLWETRATKKELVVLAWDKDGVPQKIREYISDNSELSSVPFSRESMKTFRNPKTGTMNIYMRVPAKYVKDDYSILDWMPKKNGINFARNGLDDRPPEKAWLSLFYFGNKKLVSKIKKHNWDWGKLPHPKTVPEKAFFIPVATKQ